MKESVFNYYFSINNRRYLFNTNNSGLLELTKNEFCEEEKQYLIEHRFYVSDEEDEIQNLEDEINNNICQKNKSLELTIALTNQCNFNCVYCYQDKEQKIMTKQTSEKIVHKIEQILSIDEYEEICIHYFGGEPLLNIPVLYFLDKNIKIIADKNGIEYHSYLTTNGSMMSDDILSTIKFDTIQLTFEGREEIHNRLRVSEKFHFKEEMELLEKILRKTKANIVLRMNACEQNKDEILDFYKYIIERYGYDRIIINLNRMIKCHEEDDFTMLSQKEFAKLYFDLQVLVGKMKGSFDLPVPKGIPCKFICDRAYSISPEGKCVFCRESMEESEMLFENIDITERKEIKFREECKKCICLPLCLGGCNVQNGMGQTNCTYEKYYLDKILQQYLEKWEN